MSLLCREVTVVEPRIPGFSHGECQRAIHLYYQRDNRSYPIEIQLWCGKDFLFNTWSHQYVYKYRSAATGKALYMEYCEGKIATEQDFQNRLKEVQNYG